MAEFTVNVEELLAQYKAGEITSQQLAQAIQVEANFVLKVILHVTGPNPFDR
jgi:predicted RNA-binding protein associated with RNAse of E/G family